MNLLTFRLNCQITNLCLREIICEEGRIGGILLVEEDKRQLGKDGGKDYQMRR